MYKFIKRFFDIALSLFVLMILLPLCVPIMIGLKFTGEGYIFYFQKRIGYKSKYFDIWKFATMLKDSPNIGTGMITIKNDPRLTPLGGFLRKTKINEIPQLINVLKGNMSIVGPRPTVKKHADAYGQEMRDKIYSIKPGITGIGSLIFRDEENIISKFQGDPFENYKKIIIPYKSDVELWYQENRSFFIDLQIIILTALVIFFPNSEIVYKWFPTLPKRDF
jgi:lipopolysaccharide/colanic/teichoic acid biosynthesis glycosyltransferase